MEPSLDRVNALFELAAAALLWLNVRRLFKDKVVRGVSLTPVVVFTLWGFWNLHYYSSLDQVFSALAAGFVAVANTAWMVLAAHYTLKEKRDGVRDLRDAADSLARARRGDVRVRQVRDGGDRAR